jgi:translation initiation factor IF-2
MPVDKLLEQLGEAGMKFSGPDQVVTSTEKVKLLGFLRRTHGKAEKPAEDAAPKQITLNRRKVQEITVAAGKSKTTVAVEVRQKRTYVKRSEVDAPENPEREDAQRKLAESQARNQAEVAALNESDRRRREDEDRKRADEEAARVAREQEETNRQAEASAAVEVEAPAAPVAPVREPIRETIRIVEPPSRNRGTDEKAHGHGHQRHANKPARGHVAGRPEGSPAEDDAGRRSLKGELHLSDAGSARRVANKKKPKTRQAEGSRQGSGQHGFAAPVVREIAFGDSISVADLAAKLALKGGEVVKALFKMGVMVTINQVIDHDTAVLVVEELGHTAVRASENDAESALIAHSEEMQGEKHARPPVVTIMGHVDHGKTSLLDYIRRTKVAAGEAGGITQHIGAYHVETAKGVISFLDTPGHAAFTAMRARGARLTDIVVLVVAADDGVMPQTKEAIQHARAAGCRWWWRSTRSTSPTRTRTREAGTGPARSGAEEFGGDVPCCSGVGQDRPGHRRTARCDAAAGRSAGAQGRGRRRAKGVVIESALDKGRGPVATVLVQQGTLKKGDFLVCGVQYGRVRAMFDEAGKQSPRPGRRSRWQVLGLSGVPDAGDDFAVVEDERLAKDVAQQRDAKRRESRLVKPPATAWKTCWRRWAGRRPGAAAAQPRGQGRRAGFGGSAAPGPDRPVQPMRSRSTCSSPAWAASPNPTRIRRRPSKATIIGFNVRADASARRIIEQNGIDLRYFSIIYDVIDQVKQVASGLLGVEIREEIIGIARCATCSAAPSSARWPAAWSSRVRSSATSRSACCATTPSSSRASSNRCVASRTWWKRSATAWSAALRSRPTTTSSRATRSNASNASRWQRTL